MIRPQHVPTILFGAFDRHNFGDLLFPHIAAALLQREGLIHAGLAARDLRTEGGHAVRALTQVAAQWGEKPVNIFHAGGELLGCDAWQAAVMLLTPERALDVVMQWDAHPQERMAWAQRTLGLAALAPYTVSRSLFPGTARMIYNAVGGVDLDERDPLLRAEVLDNLRAADAVGVRDKPTQAQLAHAGVQTRLMPDCAVMTAELFGPRIRAHAARGEVAQVLRALPQGYVAAQFSTDFDDDATLDRIAAQLGRAAREHRCGIVLFRAGAAPWHDDLSIYRRAAVRMRSVPVRIFSSLDIWDICALLAGCRAYAGSSLHGRIVAMAFARPRINLVQAAVKTSKQAAFAEAWEAAGLPAVVGTEAMADGIAEAMAAAPDVLEDTATRLAADYRRAFEWLKSSML